tara:strand:- start:45 stop:230 length:186 start_codon:yes stop_codon:yes gene_type:complete
VILVLLFTTSFFVSDAYAYLDPGTGSVLIQALLGVLVGLVITLKIYWSRLKEKLSGYSKPE